MKIVIAVRRGVAGDSVTRTEDGIFGEEVTRKLGVITAAAEVPNVCRMVGREGTGYAPGDASG